MEKPTTLWTTVLEETRKLPGPTRGKDRTKIAELFTDERCSQALLDFLAATDVGRAVGPARPRNGKTEKRSSSHC